MTGSVDGSGAASVAVLVVEDHPVMRGAVAQSVDRTEGFAVVATASSGRDALRVLADTVVDLALVDLSLPDMSGTRLIAEIMTTSSHTRCLVLSGHREPHYVAEARDVGARGYIVKGNPSEVAEALRAVGAGGEYFSYGIGTGRVSGTPG
jgi:DNA-binding NarL/FixJ family response regulator